MGTSKAKVKTFPLEASEEALALARALLEIEFVKNTPLVVDPS